MQDSKNVLTKLASFGYKELEAYGMDNEKAKAFFNADTKKLIGDLGMKMVSSHAMAGRIADKSVKDGIDVFAPNWKKTVALGLEMGLKYITIPWTEENFRQSLDGYKQCAEVLNKLGEYANKQGLKFSYHNHDFEFKEMEGQNLYDVMLKDCDPKFVQFEMDLYWVVYAGKDPLSFFNKYPGRFPQWHVKDMNKEDKTKNTDVGMGGMDFAKIFQAAKIAGAKHFFVEQETGYNPDSLSSAKNCADYLKKMNF